MCGEEPDFKGLGILCLLENPEPERSNTVNDSTQSDERARWLASFPEINPNPVIEINANGVITFANGASHKILKSLGLPENPALFIPDDKEEILRLLKEGSEHQIVRKITLDTASFSETIILVRELQVVRIYAVDITEHKLVEEKLRRAYELTSTILESISGSFIVLDKNWHFTFINQRAEIPTISPADVIGKTIWEVFPEIIGTPLETLYREVMANRKPRTYENKSIVASGRYFELQVYPIEESGLAIFGQDITERKEAEVALDEAHLRTTAILEGIADTFYSLDSQWRFVTVNPAAEKAPFGRPATEMLGRVIWELYPALLGTRIHQHYLDAAEKYTMEHYEAQSPLNGRWYDVFMQGREGGVDVYMRDITERREAEVALRESEKRYKELVENANSIIIKMDSQGKISFFNDFAQNYFGYSLNEILGQDVKIIIPQTDSNSGRSLEEMTKSILNNPDDFAENINENVRKNGERVWISWRNRAIRDSDGKIIGNLAIGQDITERRKAEEALRETKENLLHAQELLEAVTKATDVIIAVQDTDLRYIFFNQTYKEEIKRLTGKDLAIGTSMVELFAEKPEEQKRSIDEWSKVLKGENINQIIEFGHPGKHRRIYRVLHTPIRDAHGTIVGAGEVAYDVTKHVQVEDKLRETKEYLDNLIMYANAPIIVWDPQFRITLFNRAFEHLTGRKAKEVIGKHMDILIPENSLTMAMDLIRKTMDGQRWDSVEMPILHKQGKIRTVLWNSAAIFGADGKTIVSTIAQGQDITDRKKIESDYRLRAAEYAKMNEVLEEEIRHRKVSDTTLKKTLSLLNASLESTADGILVIDQQDRITGYNQNFMDMWSIPRGLLESGENEDVIKHVLPQLKNPEEFLASIQELHAHPSRESYDMIEFNDERIVERYSKPQKIGDSIVGRVWSYRDVTDRKHAEEKLIASVQEKEVLLREIHHRVKNNLQLVAGLLDMTRMRTEDESTNSILTDLMLKIQTMAQIHTRLYESKQFGRINITGQIRDQVTALSNIYSHKGHEIICEIPSQEVILQVDQALPCALVVNEILSNAYKHAFKGRKKGKIEISAVQENGQIRITVRDNGIGIPVDFDISRSNSLGLKLIRTLVQHQLKGSLMVKSQNGTEISMEFPVIIAGT